MLSNRKINYITIETIIFVELISKSMKTEKIREIDVISITQNGTFTTLWYWSGK